MPPPVPGRASSEATAAHARAVTGAGGAAPDQFRSLGRLALSSIGIGTYLGPADDATDAGYQAAVRRALELGLNVIDTASNYRHQRSERAVGRALGGAVADGLVARDRVVVASKAGFLAFDGARPADPRAAIQETWVERGLLDWDQVVAGCHTLAPGYLRHTLEQSRANLGLETIDIYYLHNPETQLDEVDRPRFLRRMRAAFEVLEQAVADGAIGCYGTATWTGYRVPPDHPAHLSLPELVRLARELAGEDHHFRVVQLPFNPTMLEARDAPTQELEGRRVPALEAAAELGIYVMSSASVAQGAVPAPAALDLARSTRHLGTALVGMKSPAHVEQNAALLARPPGPAR